MGIDNLITSSNDSIIFDVSLQDVLDNSIIKLLFTNISQIVKENKKIENRLNETFEQESVGILNIYLNYKITNVNSKCVSLFKYSKEELIGKNVINMTYKEDKQRIISKINHLLENPKEKYFSFEKDV